MGTGRPVTDIRQVKRGLRKKFREIRLAMDPQEKAAWDRRITANLLRSPRYRKAERVLLFVSKPIEIDTHSLIRTALQQGKQVLLPRCLNEQGHMEFFAIQSWEDLVPGLYGLLEPDPERCPCIQTFRPTDFCLVPGFSFDAKGYRLGFGKGYYDRFLAGGGSPVLLCRGVLPGLLFFFRRTVLFHANHLSFSLGKGASGGARRRT